MRKRPMTPHCSPRSRRRRRDRPWAAGHERAWRRGDRARGQGRSASVVGSGGAYRQHQPVDRLADGARRRLPSPRPGVAGAGRLVGERADVVEADARRRAAAATPEGPEDAAAAGHGAAHAGARFGAGPRVSPDRAERRKRVRGRLAGETATRRRQTPDLARSDRLRILTGAGLRGRMRQVSRRFRHRPARWDAHLGD